MRLLINPYPRQSIVPPRRDLVRVGVVLLRTGLFSWDRKPARGNKNP